MGVSSWVELGAEGVQGGLVAVGQGWVIGFVGVAFGMSGGEWVIVGVDGWLLMMWVWLVVVGVAAIARGGSRRVDGGGWAVWLGLLVFHGVGRGCSIFPNGMLAILVGILGWEMPCLCHLGLLG